MKGSISLPSGLTASPHFTNFISSFLETSTAPQDCMLPQNCSWEYLAKFKMALKPLHLTFFWEF